MDKNKFVLFASCVMISSSALSDESKSFGVETKVLSELTWTNNVYRAPSREKSSSILTVAPEINITGGSAKSSLSFNAGAELGRYSVSSRDNYLDSRISADWALSPTPKFRLGVGASIENLHEDRGTGRTSGGAVGNIDPDEYRETEVSFNVGYGTGRGTIDLELSRMSRSPENNSAQQRARDFDVTTADLEFGWQLAPKTKLIAQYIRSDTDYSRLVGGGLFFPGGTNGFPVFGTINFGSGNQQNLNLDSDTRSTFVGLEWDATAKTTGRVKFGRTRKDFKDSFFTDASDGSWEVGIQWRPRSYSTVNITSSRATNESTGIGSAAVTTAHSVTWGHAWNDRYSTNVGLSRSSSDFQDKNQEDDLTTLSVGSEYQMKRWLSLTAGFEVVKNDSNVNVFDYDRNALTVGVEVTF